MRGTGSSTLLFGAATDTRLLWGMEIDVGSLRCMAPSLGIPPHRHYDPSDVEDAALRLQWAKFLFRAGHRLRYPQVRGYRENTDRQLLRVLSLCEQIYVCCVLDLQLQQHSEHTHIPSAAGVASTAVGVVLSTNALVAKLTRVSMRDPYLSCVPAHFSPSECTPVCLAVCLALAVSVGGQIAGHGYRGDHRRRPARPYCSSTDSSYRSAWANTAVAAMSS